MPKAPPPAQRPAADTATEPSSTALREAYAAVDRALTAKRAAGDGTAAEKDTLRTATPFQRAVWAATTLVPAGKVATYGTIAAWARKLLQAVDPLNAGDGQVPVRATGQALRRNPLAPNPVPCHRVVAAGGKIGGFFGSTENCELSRKCKLLQQERVEFSVRPFARVAKQQRTLHGQAATKKAADANASVVAPRCVL